MIPVSRPGRRSLIEGSSSRDHGLGRADSFSFRIRSPKERGITGPQILRDTVKTSLINLGLISAFLCTLANAIYVNPPSELRCGGQTRIEAVWIIEWVSMGCYFLVIMLTIILATDMDGLPDETLIFHLKRNALFYASPLPFAIAGTFLLALGYGMDLDERVGCGIMPFGSVAAPCFPALVISVMVYAKERRKASAAACDGGGPARLGRAVFSTWWDLIDGEEEREEARDGESEAERALEGDPPPT